MINKGFNLSYQLRTNLYPLFHWNFLFFSLFLDSSAQNIPDGVICPYQMRGECVDEGCKFEHLWVVRVCMCVRHIFSPFDLTNLHTINPISQYKNTNDIPRLEYPTYPYFHYNPVCAVYKSSRLAFKPHQFMFPTPTPYYWSQTHFLPNKKKKKKQIINQKLGHKRNRARGEKSSNRKWIENGVRKKSKKKMVRERLNSTTIKPKTKRIKWA